MTTSQIQPTGDCISQQQQQNHSIQPNQLQTTTTADVSSTPTLSSSSTTITAATTIQPKRLHVSNIPFRFRDPDLRQLFGVSNIFLMLSI